MVTITGDKALDKALAQLEAKIVKKHLRRSMRKGLKDVIAPQIKANYPKDTGLASKQVKVRAGKRKAGQIRLKADISADNKKWPEFTGRDGKTRKKFYPVVIEYGSSDRRPLAPMRRAFDGQGGEAIDVTLADLKAKIEKEAKNLGGK